MAQLEHHPVHQKVASSISCKGAYPWARIFLKLLKTKLSTQLEIHYTENPVCVGGGDNYFTELMFQGETYLS